ncbi:MAG: response regulator transcription factor [Thermoleophilia bacterium]|jgi:DNA-binding NarL/FixJ family response regulator|nr:response regulator transcription factor [Thermoleophilia bacterium]
MNDEDVTSGGPIRVIVADDHTILREGVCSLLALQSDIEVVGEASDGAEALELLGRAAVDVVIMDMVMPRMNGLEATREIKRRWPGVKILILSMYDDDAYVQQVIQAGASGYVLKRVATEDLVQAIREVHSGASFLYPPIAAKLIDDYRRVISGDAPPGTVGVLTPREQEVLRLIAEGNTNQDIADILGLSRKTVESHRGNIMRKLALHDVTDLVKYAIRKGVVRLQ